MKNKRLIGIIAALAVLVAGSLIYSSMNKPEAKNWCSSVCEPSIS